MPSSDSNSNERERLTTGASRAAGQADARVRDSDRLEGICGEVIGRYTLHARIASGGMASVYLGSLTGAAEFSRVVAIKRMHPQFASDPTFAQRFRDEAWLSVRLMHPNVVQTFDVVEWGSELLLVMEYIDGVTFKTLCADASAAVSPLPPSIAAGILVPALHGLHAAHTATDDEGRSLRIVHRDFSPQNIIVGRDGHAKILDFGIARARSHLHVSVVGELSGKYGYLAPEQITGCEIDQRTDVFAAGIVLWEALTGERLFREPGLSNASTIGRVLSKAVVPPSHFNPALPPSVDEIVLRALQRDRSQRFVTARDLALELEAALPLASPSTIGTYMSDVSAARLERLSRTLARARRRSAAAARARARTEHTCPLGTPDDTHVTEISGEPMLDDAPEPRPRRRLRSALFFGAGLLNLILVLGGIGFAQREHFRARPSLAGTTTPLEPPAAAIHTSAAAAAASAASGPSASALDAKSTAAAASGSSASALDAKSMAAAASGSSASALDAKSMETATSGPSASALDAKSMAPVAERTASRPAAKTEPARSGVRPSPKPAKAGASRAGKPNTPASAEAACDPPTYLDSEGIRHFKAGCL